MTVGVADMFFQEQFDFSAAVTRQQDYQKGKERLGSASTECNGQKENANEAMHKCRFDQAEFFRDRIVDSVPNNRDCAQVNVGNVSE